MSNSITNTLNSRLRISGLSSGLDTEGMITKLMAVEKSRVNKVIQSRQTLEWKRDSYREISNLLRGLKDKYFDVLSPTNLKSASTFNKNSVTVTDPTVVKAVAGGSAVASTHSIEVTQIATVGKVEGTATHVGGNFTSAGDIKLGTVTYTYAAGSSVKVLADQINADTSIGAGKIKATYDATNDKLTLATQSTGAVELSGSLLTQEVINIALAPDGKKYIGKNAEYTYDGLVRNTNSNSFTEDGVTYTLTKAGSANVVLDKDIDGIVSNIKGYVEEYNKVLTTLNLKLSEKKNREYLPLTDEQKESMKEADIAKWEGKAKSGLLAGDSNLNDIVNKLRRAVSDPIYETNGVPTSLIGTMSSIGITTGAYYEKGMLTIDETKLRAALTTDSALVEKIFTKASVTPYNPDSNVDVGKRYNENGMSARIDDILNNNIRTTSGKGTLIKKAGKIGDTTELDNILQDSIDGKNTAINILLGKLSDKENYYYTKFSAMESALSKMNSQSSWLTQQFSGGQ